MPDKVAVTEVTVIAWPLIEVHETLKALNNTGTYVFCSWDKRQILLDLIAVEAESHVVS